MSEGKRPGGLTALAVLNFVFAAFGVIGILALWAFYALATTVTTAAETMATATQATEGAQEMANAASAVSAVTQQTGPIILIGIIISLVSVILLIVSGVGYLRQKKFLGQRLGSLYGIASIAQSVYSIMILKTGFGIGTIIGLTFAALTLLLLNIKFKDDFVNP